MHYLLTVLTALLLTGGAFAQNAQEVLYHSIEFTASRVKLIKFDIKPKSGQAYVKETIDNLGRTEQLEFFNWRGELDWAGSGFYGGPLIKYKYEPGRIIETFFQSSSDLANDFRWSEVPYRFIYHVDETNAVTEVESVYKIDFHFNQANIDSTIEHLKLYRDFAPSSGSTSSDIDHVFGYSYAKGKLDGVSPKVKD